MSAVMRHSTKFLLAATLLAATGCKSELDGKPVAKVGEVKTETKVDAKAADAKATDAKAAPRVMKADPAASSIGFVGAKLTGDHKGEFKKFSGEATLAGNVPSALRFTVETASVEADDPGLTDHLRGKDFFDAEQYPKAEFVTTSIVAKVDGAANYELTGNLDLHGIQKSIVFPATITVDERSAKGTAEFKINRKDFKIEYPGKPDDLIKDEVLLKISLSFVP